MILSAEELSAIREVGELGMTQRVWVFRGSQIDTSQPGFESSDFGDSAFSEPDELDAYGDPEGEPIGDAYGWFVTQNMVFDPTATDGQLATVDRHVVRFPWGTDIRPDDVLRKDGSTEDFEVIDTNGDDTWAEWLRVTVLRRE